MRCHDDPTLFLLCMLIKMQSHGLYFVDGRNVRRRMLFYNGFVDPTLTNKDAVALFRHCMRL